MPRTLHPLAAFLAVPLVCVSFAHATPPTDEQIDALIANIDKAGADQEDAAAKRAARRDAAEDELKHLAINEATWPQVQKILDKRMGTVSPELAAALESRLGELAKAKGVDGAKAAEARLALQPPPAKKEEARAAYDKRMGELVAAALDHDGTPDLLKSGGGSGIFRAAGSLSATALTQNHIIEKVTPLITPELSQAAVMSLPSLIQPAVGAREKIGNDTVEQFRVRTSAAIGAAHARAVAAREERMKKIAAAPKPDENDKDAQQKAKVLDAANQLEERQLAGMQSTRELLDGPWARGTLLGNPAPAINFTWSSTKEPIHSFKDLEGKVVLVDFWATWCGPCVAAFPKMRELQARYAGYNVTILGVTSDQGYSIERKPGQKPSKIDCKGDPSKEHALMTEFMRDMDMTWNVAFGDKNVFNPDFGIRGIPSVAIIDSKGVVRFAGLYPDPKDESEKIDMLLKEAKLPCPEQPYIEPSKDGGDKSEGQKEPKKAS